jgi:hypothetical protein
MDAPDPTGLMISYGKFCTEYVLVLVLGISLPSRWHCYAPTCIYGFAGSTPVSEFLLLLVRANVRHRSIDDVTRILIRTNSTTSTRETRTSSTSTKIAGAVTKSKENCNESSQFSTTPG